jgi:hypothetical protein
MVAAGLLAGAYSPNQLVPSTPFRPASAKVGTSANYGLRVAADVAKMRVLPLRSNPA